MFGGTGLGCGVECSSCRDDVDVDRIVVHQRWSEESRWFLGVGLRRCVASMDFVKVGDDCFQPRGSTGERLKVRNGVIVEGTRREMTVLLARAAMRADRRKNLEDDRVQIRHSRLFRVRVESLEMRQLLRFNARLARDGVASLSRPLKKEIVHQGKGVPQSANDELRGVLVPELTGDVGLVVVVQARRADDPDQRADRRVEDRRATVKDRFQRGIPTHRGHRHRATKLAAGQTGRGTRVIGEGLATFVRCWWGAGSVENGKDVNDLFLGLMMSD